jgi:hypothetical protein
MRRLSLVLAFSMIVSGCVAPAPRGRVVHTVPNPQMAPATPPAAGSKRITYDGVGNFTLPDGTTVPADDEGGFTLPNGAQVTPDGTGGLVLPNGARCVSDGTRGYICP